MYIKFKDVKKEKPKEGIDYLIYPQYLRARFYDGDWEIVIRKRNGLILGAQNPGWIGGKYVSHYADIPDEETTTSPDFEVSPEEILSFDIDEEVGKVLGFFKSKLNKTASFSKNENEINVEWPEQFTYAIVKLSLEILIECGWDIYIKNGIRSRYITFTPSYERLYNKKHDKKK